MEKLLHYIWKYKLFPLKPLQTTDGLTLEVIDPGTLNRDAGPDFFNAKIKLDGTTWVGNIEIHGRATDWYAHGHHEDTHYNNVILHVTETADRPIVTQDGKTLPQLIVEVPGYLRENYEELCRTTDYPRCHRIIPQIDPFTVHSWMNALLYERLEQRARTVAARVEKLQGDWERAYFITLSRNFGFGINGDAFEVWAQHIPLQAVAHHRDNLFQIEAIFMGQAGLLDFETIPKKYRKIGIQMVISMAITFIIGNLILKNLIARERPCWLDTQIALLIKSPKDYSFPSGHSMNGFAASIALLCNDKKLGIPAVILASLIAFSRLYHFVHFPTDVMVGILIGTTVAILVHVGYLRWSRRHFS